MLKKYDIHSMKVKVNCNALQGYRREHLWDARVYREMRQERIETQDATRMTYVLTQIAKIIQAAELEARIEAVERALGTRRS